MVCCGSVLVFVCVRAVSVLPMEPLSQPFGVSSCLHLDFAHLHPNSWSAFLSQHRFGNFAPYLSGDNEFNFFGKVSSSPKSCPDLRQSAAIRGRVSAAVAFHQSGAMTTPNSKLQHPGIAMSHGTHTNTHDDHKDEDLSELKRRTNSSMQSGRVYHSPPGSDLYQGAEDCRVLSGFLHHQEP